MQSVELELAELLYLLRSNPDRWFRQSDLGRIYPEQANPTNRLLRHGLIERRPAKVGWKGSRVNYEYKIKS